MAALLLHGWEEREREMRDPLALPSLPPLPLSLSAKGGRREGGRSGIHDHYLLPPSLFLPLFPSFQPNRLDIAHCSSFPLTLVFLPAADIAAYVSSLLPSFCVPSFPSLLHCSFLPFIFLSSFVPSFLASSSFSPLFLPSLVLLFPSFLPSFLPSLTFLNLPPFLPFLPSFLPSFLQGTWERVTWIWASRAKTSSPNPKRTSTFS